MSNRVRTVGKRIAQHPAVSNGAGRPAPYRLHQYVWHCSSDDFCIEVRSNLSLKERDDFIDAEDAVFRYSDEWVKAQAEDPDSVDHEDTPRRRRLELMVPFIRDWNVVGEDAVTGEERSVPSPRVAGVEAFRLVALPHSAWIMETISTAYRLGKGFSSSNFDHPSEATAETSSDGSIDDPSTKTSPSPATPPSSPAPTDTT